MPAATAKKRFPRFVCLIGKHVQHNPHRVCNQCGKVCDIRKNDCPADGEGKHNCQEMHRAAPDGRGGFLPSEPFESDLDLSRRWPEKFAEIRENFVQAPAPIIGLNPETIYAKFEKMKVPQLKAMCEAQEISLDGAVTKDEILAAIRRSYEGEAAEPVGVAAGDPHTDNDLE